MKIVQARVGIDQGGWITRRSRLPYGVGVRKAIDGGGHVCALCNYCD